MVALNFRYQTVHPLTCTYVATQPGVDQHLGGIVQQHHLAQLERLPVAHKRRPTFQHKIQIVAKDERHEKRLLDHRLHGRVCTACRWGSNIFMNVCVWYELINGIRFNLPASSTGGKRYPSMVLTDGYTELTVATRDTVDLDIDRRAMAVSTNCTF